MSRTKEYKLTYLHNSHISLSKYHSSLLLSFSNNFPSPSLLNSQYGILYTCNQLHSTNICFPTAIFNYPFFRSFLLMVFLSLSLLQVLGTEGYRNAINDAALISGFLRPISFLFFPFQFIPLLIPFFPSLLIYFSSINQQCIT